MTFALGTVVLSSCADYEDDIDSLKDRVTYLESLVDQVNRDIEQVQTLVDAMQTGDVITRVDTLYTSDNVMRGYKFYFMKHDPIEVLNGVDGAPGNNAFTPIFSAAANDQGDYCWLVSYDGGQTYDWLRDDQGNMVVAVGKDGEPGQAVTPLLRITHEGYWQVSYDNGLTWSEPLRDPITNELITSKGKDGVSKDPIFIRAIQNYIEGGVTQSWTFVTPDGGTFVIEQPVMAQSVTISKDGKSVDVPIHVSANSPFQLSATISPKEVSYSDIFWYVAGGNVADIIIENPNAATTNMRMLTPGTTVVLRAMARYSEFGKPAVYGEVSVVCDN